MKYIIIASAFAATAYATLEISALPTCALNCALTNKPDCLNLSDTAPGGGVSPANNRCVCDSDAGKTFQAKTSSCVQASAGICSLEDQCKLYNAVLTGCGSISSDVVVPEGCHVAGGAPAPGSGTHSSSVAPAPPATEPTSAPPAAGGAKPPPSSSTEEAAAPTSNAAASETATGSASATYSAAASSTVATSASGTASSAAAPVTSEVAVGAASANAVNGVVALVAGLFVALAL